MTNYDEVYEAWESVAELMQFVAPSYDHLPKRTSARLVKQLEAMREIVAKTVDNPIGEVA